MKKIKYPELVGEMAKHGHTQKTLGELIGVSYPCISRRLSGETEWNISDIEKICEFYKKDYYELFKTEKEKN